jgi:hypothetical protein
VQHNAEQEQADFMQLGCGTLCYLLTLDHDAVKALCGADAEIAANETAVCLVDADGSPHLIRGTVADCLLEAAERGLTVVPIN